jgi:GMP synthase (glutamine-hydrolysing)
MKPQIAILDFGSQYTHLITRRIRQLGVLARIYSPTVDLAELRGIKGIILSGGPQSVHDDTALKYNKDIFKFKVPILGLCYGHQLISYHFNGQVKSEKIKEYGLATLQKVGDNILLDNFKNSTEIWMSHGDQVKKIPFGFKVIARTKDCVVAGMAHDEQKLYGLQFHPEVHHTQNGLKILENFLFQICLCEQNWSMEKYWEQLVQDIKKKVGQKNVFLLVSGGVDSSVCFALLEKILGKKRVFGLHVDNGFMHLNESKQVKKYLAQAGFNDLEVVDASEQFLKKEKNIINPEKKRKIIGQTFLDIKDEVMKKMKMDPKQWILAQGTIYPDTIESGATKNADKIKTHHNRVAQILKLIKLEGLIEPLADLYKDEVREIGQKLKLPSSLINRHPFPGPGLAIRTLCSDGKEFIDNEKVLNEKLNRILGNKLKFKILPFKSVGVQGDNRTYKNPALITGNVSWKELNNISIQITNSFSEINRVVYLPSQLGGKCGGVPNQKVDLSQIKIKKAYLTKERLDLLRKVDDLVHKEIAKNKLYKNIWQFPVILAPLSLNEGDPASREKLGETIILRPVESKEAMTVNFYQMPKKILNSLVKKILQIEGVDLVLYDITNKPPGTIEWE